MGAGLLSLFFPPFCIGCGYLGQHICKGCLQALKNPQPECFYCGGSSIHGLTHPACSRRNGVDGFLSLYYYGGVLVELLHRSKYNGEWVLLRDLLFHTEHKNKQILQWWKKFFKPTLCPTPLHSTREKNRGFNQSTIISSAIATGEGFGVCCALVRHKNTLSQVSMQRPNDRLQNVRGAFGVVGGAIPKSIMLIDDVVTSGSTIRECAATLKRAGVRTVLAVSIAKG